MDQRLLLVARVEKMFQPEPGVVDLVVVQFDDTQATLRMNLFAARKMAKLIAKIGG